MSTHPSRPRAAPGENESIQLSPLMTMMPTGYRTIQPLQKGKGWHTNGRVSRHRAALAQPLDDADIDQHTPSEKERGVVFPLLTGQEHARPGSQGPDVSAVEGATISTCSVGDDRQEADEVATVISPRAPSTPSNGVPRRPDVRVNTGGSFRSRALSGSPSNGSFPTSPATTSEENSRARVKEGVKAVPGPDPVIMQQLWQEYATRSHAANRQVDAATYHEKMHRRYGEQRALKERIAQLEQTLEVMERERNEAQAQTESATKQLELLVQDRSTTELPESGATSPTMRTVGSSFIKVPSGVPDNAEEKSYRERSFVLERALAQAKLSLSTAQEQLRKQATQAAERTQSLEAQLVLERNTNLELARQLREISAGFTRASAELVETRVTLQREQQRLQEISEQARVQNAQLLSDSRRAQLETRMKLAVRSLGREALRSKMETLMSRTTRAEQKMRVAQLETERVCQERDAIREQLEQVLSSHALKYHSLGAAGGVPGILERSTQLSNSARMVNDQLLLLQVTYEETVEPEDPDDSFCVHFVAYEPRSAQDDFLTFHLRDIQRLVPNHESFLAQHSVRRRERLEALAELLLAHVHAGYKNGHLVLAETSGPEAAMRLPQEQLLAQQEQQQTHKVAVYRGTRYLPLVGGDDDAVLVDLDVTEAFAAATSQVWWLEIRVVVLGCEGCDGEPLTAKVDLRQLLTFCATFASYRPSENDAGGNNDDVQHFGMHEGLLEPLFDSLRVVFSGAGSAILEVVAEVESRPSTGIQPQNHRRRLSVENQDSLSIGKLDENVMVLKTTPTPGTLTHQSVVNVNDVFYCVRLQELWDGELLLDITMDDPDTQQHFHRVLHESQLEILADRLVQDGALDNGEHNEDTSREDQEAVARQVKYGLASVLHRPLCKLVQCNAQPILPHPSQVSTKSVTEAGGISLRTLFNDEGASNVQQEVRSYETRSMVLDPVSCAALGWRHEREVRVITASTDVLSDERAVQQVLQEMLALSRQNSGVITRQRLGVRFRDNAGFSLVQTVSANLTNCGDVAIFDMLPLTPGPSYLPLVVVVEDPTNEDPPLQQVFDALGLDQDSPDFTRNALRSSRTGGRAEEEAESAPS